jgi:hypothetical protein
MWSLTSPRQARAKTPAGTYGAILSRRTAGTLPVLFGLAWLAAFAGGAAETNYQPDQHYYGRSNYVEYIAGDLPIIFSVPHGGELKPREIPDRTCKGRSADCATIGDAYTEELGLAVREAFRSYFGHSPHLVICHLRRTKLDCNREIDEAAEGNAHAQQAWREYHGYISSAISAVLASPGRGLYIDLHGQSHPLKRIELGYLLTPDQLTNSDAVLNQPAFTARSSFRTLAAAVPIPFSQLLRGSNSLGGLLLSKGYPSLPDPVMPNTRTRIGSGPSVGGLEDYFGGGYSTRSHSSAGEGGPMDAVQLEANLEGVRDTADHRAKFALALAQVMDRFFALHYRIDLKTGAPLSASAPSELQVGPYSFGGCAVIPAQLDSARTNPDEGGRLHFHHGFVRMLFREL